MEWTTFSEALEAVGNAQIASNHERIKQPANKVLADLAHYYRHFHASVTRDNRGRIKTININHLRRVDEMTTYTVYYDKVTTRPWPKTWAPPLWDVLRNGKVIGEKYTSEGRVLKMGKRYLAVCDFGGLGNCGSFDSRKEAADHVAEYCIEP